MNRWDGPGAVRFTVATARTPSPRSATASSSATTRTSAATARTQSASTDSTHAPGGE